MHIKPVCKLLSYILLVIALIMLIPAAVAFGYNETEAAKAFLFTVCIMIIVSLSAAVLLRNEKISFLSPRDSYLFTGATWILTAVFGAIPLVITNTIPSYSQSFFEIMSGITTTGATMINNIEGCYKSIQFFRALVNWLGGMGIVVLFVAILPAVGASGNSFNMIGAETVGPVKGKLTPKTKTTAIVLWAIYFGLTAAQTISLMFGKLGFFDALTVSFSTMSTAGFSIKNQSIAAYNSAYVDIIVTLFMVLASINFTMYFKMLTGRGKEALKDPELKTFFAIWGSASVIQALDLTLKGRGNFLNSLRYSSFISASVISTTGFSNTDFLSWPSFAIMAVIMLMFVGGCSGSTGGGIKVSRVSVLMKSSVISLKQRIHPNAVYTLKLGDTEVNEATLKSIFNFVFMYIATWLFGALIVSLTGTGIIDCLSSSILTLGNIGLGFGTKLFSEYPIWISWVFSFLMLAGRLELFTIYVMFSKAFWKN